MTLEGRCMKVSAAIRCGVMRLISVTTVWADPLMDVYKQRYELLTSHLDLVRAEAKVAMLSNRRPGAPPVELYRLTEVQLQKNELKIQLLEKHKELPEWWKD
jgi:hypothetical protein